MFLFFKMKMVSYHIAVWILNERRPRINAAIEITKNGIITAAFNRVHTVCWRAKFGVTLFKRKIWSFWWLTYINLSNSYLDMRYQDNCNTMSSTSKGIYKMIRKYPCNFTKQLFASGSVDFIGYETKKRR